MSVDPRTSFQPLVLPYKMHLSCIFFFFFLISIVPSFSLGHNLHSSTSKAIRDIINETCNRCAEQSPAVDFGFCLASLDPITITHITNLQGLAIVSMELALENATTTLTSIKEILGNGSYAPFEVSGLEKCSELYSGAVDSMVDAVGAFMIEQFDRSVKGISVVVGAADECEEGFEVEGIAVVSPLTEENYCLEQLSAIALCIVNSISSPTGSSSSDM